MLPKAESHAELRTNIVNTFNEWDPLEEVIVGVIDGASIPPWHISLQATMPEEHLSFFRKHGGQPFPHELVASAKRELDDFVHILEAEGVTVRRPESMNHSRPYSTPEWNS